MGAERGGMAEDPVLAHVIDSIVPVRPVRVEDARDDLDQMQVLVQRLAAARHATRPLLARKRALLCAADHGLTGAPAGPGGPSGRTRAALGRVAAGEAAVCAAARAAEVSLILVDCGVRGGAPGDGVVDLRLGDGTADIRQGAAMTPAQALASLRTGVALLLSVAEEGADVIALAHLSAGSRPVSSAVIAALTGMAPAALGMADRDIVTAALAANRPDPARPLAVLAAVGGFELGVLAGLVLAAASIRIPVVLDDHGTAAAALLAVRLQPAASGYLFASHTGSTPGHQRVLRELGVPVVFQAGRPQGEAVGAVLALPILEGAVRLLG